MRVTGEKIIRMGMHIGEIAPPTTGDAYLLSDLGAMVKQSDAPPMLARLNGAHKTGRTGPDNQNIIIYCLHAWLIAVFLTLYL